MDVPREAGAQASHPGSTAHKSEFIARAKRISAGITATAGKLQRLSQLAKRTSMFDDPAVQINELTGLIKADIQGLNGALTDLSTFQGRQAGSGNRQVASLSTNTVDDLRARLKDTTASFRDVLTLRQENLRVHAGRRQLFSATPESRPFPAPARPGAPGPRPARAWRCKQYCLLAGLYLFSPAAGAQGGDCLLASTRRPARSQVPYSYWRLPARSCRDVSHTVSCLSHRLLGSTPPLWRL